jgi:hypothetical protein
LPIGINASIARIPVCSGCLIGWRSITVGAVFSIVRYFWSESHPTVDGVAERIDDASEQGGTDRNRRDTPGPANLHAFFDVGIGAEDDDADVILFEVQRDALQTVGKLDELGLLHGLEPVDAGDARTDFDDGSDLVFANVALEVRDLTL